jgi:hypothetical protein
VISGRLTLLGPDGVRPAAFPSRPTERLDSLLVVGFTFGRGDQRFQGLEVA